MWLGSIHTWVGTYSWVHTHTPTQDMAVEKSNDSMSITGHWNEVNKGLLLIRNKKEHYRLATTSLCPEIHRHPYIFLHENSFF